jgi:hypothetical protein
MRRVIAVNPETQSFCAFERQGSVMSPQLNLASVPAYAAPRPDAVIVVSDFLLNHNQRFRAEIIRRDGKPVVSISRWKSTPKGPRRTGQAFEFGAHRTIAVTNLLVEVQRVLSALQAEGGAS